MPATFAAASAAAKTDVVERKDSASERLATSSSPPASPLQARKKVSINLGQAGAGPAGPPHPLDKVSVHAIRSAPSSLYLVELAAATSSSTSISCEDPPSALQSAPCTQTPSSAQPPTPAQPQSSAQSQGPAQPPASQSSAQPPQSSAQAQASAQPLKPAQQTQQAPRSGSRIPRSPSAESVLAMRSFPDAIPGPSSMSRPAQPPPHLEKLQEKKDWRRSARYLLQQLSASLSGLANDRPTGGEEAQRSSKKERKEKTRKAHASSGSGHEDVQISAPIAVRSSHHPASAYVPAASVGPPPVDSTPPTAAKGGAATSPANVPPALSLSLSLPRNGLPAPAPLALPQTASGSDPDTSELCKLRRKVKKLQEQRRQLRLEMVQQAHERQAREEELRARLASEMQASSLLLARLAQLEAALPPTADPAEGRARSRSSSSPQLALLQARCVQLEEALRRTQEANLRLERRLASFSPFTSAPLRGFAAAPAPAELPDARLVLRAQCAVRRWLARRTLQRLRAQANERLRLANELQVSAEAHAAALRKGLKAVRRALPAGGSTLQPLLEQLERLQVLARGLASRAETRLRGFSACSCIADLLCEPAEEWAAVYADYAEELLRKRADVLEMLIDNVELQEANLRRASRDQLDLEALLQAPLAFLLQQERWLRALGEALPAAHPDAAHLEAARVRLRLVQRGEGALRQLSEEARLLEAVSDSFTVWSGAAQGLALARAFRRVVRVGRARVHLPFAAWRREARLVLLSDVLLVGALTAGQLLALPARPRSLREALPPGSASLERVLFLCDLDPVQDLAPDCFLLRSRTSSSSTPSASSSSSSASSASISTIPVAPIPPAAHTLALQDSCIICMFDSEEEVPIASYPI